MGAVALVSDGDHYRRDGFVWTTQESFIVTTQGVVVSAKLDADLDTDTQIKPSKSVYPCKKSGSG
jgi:hypothetical protein